MAQLLENKAGYVTGAAGGIGRGIAQELAKEGARVVVSDLESATEGGQETVRLIEDAGGRAIFVAADVAQPDQVENLVQRTVETFGALDYAVNNAVAPNAIRTPLMDDSPPEFIEGLIAPQAMKRVGEPEEVGFAVAALLSDRSGFTTGVTLPVDGGYLTGA